MRQDGKHEDRLAQLLAMAIDLEPSLFEEVSQIAARDNLTGAYQESFYRTQLKGELSRSHLLGYPLSLLSVDVRPDPAPDYTHRTMAENELLKLICSEAARRLRVTDWVARVGEDELVLVLPGCPHSQVKGIAEDVAARIEPIRVTDYAGEEIRPVISLAAAVYDHGLPELDNLLATLKTAKFESQEFRAGQLVTRTMKSWDLDQSSA